MGWYSHMVNHRPSMESCERVSLASVRQAGKQSEIEELYVLCTELASLVQAADVVDEPSQCLLSPFVSTTHGELDQASAQKVIECMVENGLRADSLFLDIGCCYCKVLVHVAHATGINVYGVEAVRERTERGKRCVQRWKATHPELARQTGGIEIFAGDIIHNLHLLFPATHVLLLDAGFMSSARNVLKHVWGHLAGSRLQMVFTCTMLEDVNDAMLPVAQLQVKMGEENLILYAYKVNNSALPVSVEVFVSSVHGVGLRVRRDFAAGETVLKLHGTKSSTYAKDDRWPWMVRFADGWLHVENLARFVNWHYEQARVNVSMSADANGQLRLQTTRPIRKGDELLSSPSCWAFSARGELDSDMMVG
jgi:precorrin-6B methylase 2